MCVCVCVMTGVCVVESGIGLEQGKCWESAIRQALMPVTPQASSEPDDNSKAKPESIREAEEKVRKEKRFEALWEWKNLQFLVRNELLGKPPSGGNERRELPRVEHNLSCLKLESNPGRTGLRQVLWQWDNQAFTCGEGGFSPARKMEVSGFDRE